MKDLSRMLPPDHSMYTEAIEALKRYHQAQQDGVTSADLEQLRLLAELRFQAATDAQFIALGGRPESSH
ncbi:hypothetical protein [Pseudomonas sp. BNK-30]|uniref:hypothetical protein n=1 Tax=Pseudomonas sp. BNK-30 TaxID=3376165 RepID=UPI0039BF5439